MNDLLTQSFGYLASVLLAFSLIVTNDIRFRWLNSLGCAAFIIYGIALNAFPIILTNTLLFAINLFYLIRIYRTTENFDLLEFSPGDPLVHKFLNFYQGDIKKYFPDSYENPSGELRFVVLRDLVIANVFVAELTEDGTAFVNLNYTLEKFRDFKVGKFIFEKENKYLSEKGVQRIAYKTVPNKNHERFLKVMGFEKQVIEGNKCYVKYLK